MFFFPIFYSVLRFTSCSGNEYGYSCIITSGTLWQRSSHFGRERFTPFVHLKLSWQHYIKNDEVEIKFVHSRCTNNCIVAVYELLLVFSRVSSHLLSAGLSFICSIIGERENTCICKCKRVCVHVYTCSCLCASPCLWTCMCKCQCTCVWDK